MGSLRTNGTRDKYRAFIEKGILEQRCVLCEKVPLREFKYWRIMPNDFPYDRIAERHDMLVPRRHITEVEFSSEERAELLELKGSVLDEEYEFLVEGTYKKKTIPSHFHIHLLVIKN